jgi:REP element-mobilizing transposase RayT
MTTFKQKYRVESARLPKWNYASTGWYFVTICTQGRDYFFGEIKEGVMHLSNIGNTVRKFWQEIPEHSKAQIRLDEFIVMPNHVHGIIVIEERGIVETLRATSLQPKDKNVAMSRRSPRAGSLSAIIRSYKSAVKHWCNENQHLYFDWQTRFYDHLIRDEKSLNEIRLYIQNNPAKWELDKNNVANLWM